MPKLSKEEMDQIQAYLQTLPENEREEKLNQIIATYEKSPAQCPFCLMSEGKIQTTKVYDDPNYIAVLEINPANPGHTILFPKAHISSITGLSHVDTENLFKISKILSTSILSFSDGVSLYVEDGKILGKRFDHFVINIIPRLKDDDVHLVTKPKPSTPDSLKEMREKILANLPKEKKEEPKKPVVDETPFLSKDFSRMIKRRP
ncbi:HIT family protein [Candidatus Woesearchaeota archaeon]|nr:MAG: Hit-like protein involved in cell-cycle regulation [archaeon GW2011_AR18]MBS3161878.1 HIT family protein [Candidatus Woesearchaeota archaeon]HIH25178.1 HIT family protein [Nanoarchaeota archaeon]